MWRCHRSSVAPLLLGDLQWVVDAYSLTLAAFLLTSGVLGDMFGRRTIFTVGLVIFSLSSLVCGLATSSNMLNFYAPCKASAARPCSRLDRPYRAGVPRQGAGYGVGIYGAVLGPQLPSGR